MIFRPVRDLIIAIAFLGLSWAALGQAVNATNSKALIGESNSIIGVEYSGPASFRESLTQALDELISYESAVLLELRRGLDRLGKGCVYRAVPKSEAENALLSRNTLAFEQADAVIDARLDALKQTAATFAQAANRQVGQYCTGLGGGLGLGLLMSNNCKQAQALQSAVKTYQTELERYYGLQVERYRAYLDLVQIERQSCVRPGFSTRLLKANEVHMRESEEQSQRLLNQWNRDLARFLGLPEAVGAGRP